MPLLLPVARTAAGDPELKLRIGERLKLDPCEPEHELDNIREATKGEQVCPRVELHPDNDVAADLVSYGISSALSPWIRPMLDAYCEAHGIDAWDRLDLLTRVVRALGSPAANALRRATSSGFDELAGPKGAE